VLAAVCLPQRTVAQGTADRIRLAADSLLHELHERGWFSGAVVLGTNEEIYAKGFGYANVESRLPFTPDVAADGASIAKTLTAAALFMLVEGGRLDLEAPVVRYLPEYPHPKVLVWHLLAHTAGLPEAEYDFFNGLIPSHRIKTTDLLLATLRNVQFQPEFIPGTRFQYSSLGFDVAALLVERVTGKQWASFLRERVFEPLHMDRTFLRPPQLDDWTGVRTLSYRRAGDSLVIHDVFDLEGFYGGSNLYFSTRDLFRWSRSFYTRPVLSRGSLQHGSTAPVLYDSIRKQGGHSRINLLSWYYAPKAKRFHYPGALQGFWSSAYRDENRKYSIVYMSNNSMPQWLRPMLTRALIEIMEGRPAPTIEEPRDLLITQQNVGEFTGTYFVPAVGRVGISEDNNRVLVTMGNGIVYRAFFVADRQLYIPGLDVWLAFPASDTPFARVRWLSIFHSAIGARAAA
jgi:CubicO group peptidase (beta-lactamase class C family)